MMGLRQGAQAALLSEFSMEDHVPQGHLLHASEVRCEPILTNAAPHTSDFEALIAAMALRKDHNL